MKNPKKPTYAQRAFIESKRLNPMNWLVVKDSPECLEIISKEKLEKGLKETRILTK